jgi:Sodium/hydrogen exchanger family
VWAAIWKISAQASPRGCCGIGPYTPGFVGDPAAVKDLADVGIILLMFTIGLHLSVRDLMRAGTVALVGGVAQVLVTLGIGYAVGIAVRGGGTLCAIGEFGVRAVFWRKGPDTETLGVRSLLPLNQVRERQRRTPELDVEPQVEVMQGHLGGQARPEAREGMGALVLQTAGRQQAVMDRLHELADAGVPAPQGLGPVARSTALGFGNDGGPVALSLGGVPGAALKACSHHVHAAGGRAAAGQTGLRVMVQCQEGFGHALLCGPGRGTAICSLRTPFVLPTNSTKR